MLVAQMTDFHIGAPGSHMDAYRTAEHLSQAVAHLLRLSPRPDVVIGTGDLVDQGEPEEYARLSKILAPLEIPLYLIPGNHDDRENLRAAFADADYLPQEGFLCYAVDRGPLRLIGLDTLVPGQPGGLLCRERLAWLEERLSEAPERPTLLFQHHPPFASGLRAMDRIGLEGAEGLAEVVRRHPQVERIVCGHLHRPIVRRFAGTVASVCPATGHQLELDLQRDRLATVGEPPALALHLYEESLGLVSHTSYVGDYGKPVPVPGSVPEQ